MVPVGSYMECSILYVRYVLYLANIISQIPKANFSEKLAFESGLLFLRDTRFYTYTLAFHRFSHKEQKHTQETQFVKMSTLIVKFTSNQLSSLAAIPFSLGPGPGPVGPGPVRTALPQKNTDSAWVALTKAYKTKTRQVK